MPLSDATKSFKNGLRRMTVTQRPRQLARGKENYPPQGRYESTPSPTTPTEVDPHRWDPVDGMIIIKVSVPSTDDIWRFKVAEDVSFITFRAKVELKVGFPVAFVDRRGKRVISEVGFKRWVAGRVKNGRNHPIVAHRGQYSAIPDPSTPVSPLTTTFPSTPASPKADVPHSFFDMSF